MTRPDEATHPNRSAFPDGISGPALRALDTVGIRSMHDLESWTEHDLGSLHGMGPKGGQSALEAGETYQELFEAAI